ncbi:hypothetical protein [Burkholderia sp. IMCC1007]|uniref:hypothetical protein n=1 Tax=Burkholderia sp. IMCC1007 TaxID=3004104 RepID=UPI0022B495EE|nr:hypothetical protein [Burkholderia sp. IMCC1007]
MNSGRCDIRDRSFLYPASGDFPDSPKTLPPFQYAAFDPAAICVPAKADSPYIERVARVSDHSLSRSRVRRPRARPAIFFDLYNAILGGADYRMHARCHTDRAG